MRVIEGEKAETESDKRFFRGRNTDTWRGTNPEIKFSTRVRLKF